MHGGGTFDKAVHLLNHITVGMSLKFQGGAPFPLATLVQVWWDGCRACEG